MTEDYGPHEELEQLLLDLLDGEWSAGKRERLDELLRGDPSARARYRELMVMHAMLDAQFGDSPNLSGDALCAHNPGDVQRHVRLVDREAPADDSMAAFARRTRWRPYLGWVAAAAVVVFMGVWALFLRGGRRDLGEFPGRDTGRASLPGRRLTSKHSDLAVVTRLIRPQWVQGEEALRPGQLLGKRWIRLEAGIVQIECGDGARVTLEGPAQLRLDSESDCFLQAGKLTVLAPPDAANFTVKSPASEVIDLGTEFGVVVDESGELDVHVLDGQVEVAVKGAKDQPGARRKLHERQAASIRPGEARIRDVPFDQASFEPIRATTLWRTQPLKIQFDCGNRAGLYNGSTSPAHSVGDMYPHETRWNPLVGDQTGGFVLADGRVAPRRLDVDFGHGKRNVDWDAEVDTMTGPQGRTHGVFNTALGRDAVSPPSRPATGLVGLRIRGLPRGRYRVYVLGRSSLNHRNWGNFLVEKAHVAAVGTDLRENSPLPLVMAPLKDPDAGRWVAGQTHVVTDVEVRGSDQYVTIITGKDRDRSPTPAGGRAVILGVQIVQLLD